jgi:hypothetical protein
MKTKVRFSDLIRAVSPDKRLTPMQIYSFLAKTSLSGLIRQAVADAFNTAGLLSTAKSVPPQ